MPSPTNGEDKETAVHPFVLPTAFGYTIPPCQEVVAAPAPVPLRAT